jgi:hypothetical protein
MRGSSGRGGFGDLIGSGRGGYVDWREHLEKNKYNAEEMIEPDLEDTASSPIKKVDAVMADAYNNAKNKVFF